jgi:hypothetical protein
MVDSKNELCDITPEPPQFFGVRRQSKAATALWIPYLSDRSKAVSRLQPHSKATPIGNISNHVETSLSHNCDSILIQ